MLLLWDGAARLVEFAFPRFPGPFQSIVPGLPYAPGRKIEHLAQATYINADGYADRLYAIPRPAEVFRIVALGDSMTFGFGVPMGKSFVDQMEEMINRGGKYVPTEILNLGVPGFNTYEEYKALIAMGDKLEPHLVLLNYFPNDVMPDRYHPSPFAVCPPDVLPFGGLRDFFLSFALFRVFHDGYFMIRFGANPDSLGFTSYLKERNPGLACSFYYLRGIKSFCEMRRIPLLVTIVPWLSPQLTAENPAPEAYVTEHLSARFREMGIEPLDMCPALAGYSASRLSLSDTHPNELAHGLFAEYLLKKLTEKNLIPHQKK
jgi:lysophospholipase L1-like esterase